MANIFILQGAAGPPGVAGPHGDTGVAVSL